MLAWIVDSMVGIVNKKRIASMKKLIRRHLRVLLRYGILVQYCGEHVVFSSFVSVGSWALRRFVFFVEVGGLSEQLPGPR